MFKSFLVYKITKSDVTVVIDGVNKTIPRESVDSEKVIQLCKAYNSHPDFSEREKIKEGLMELLNPAKRIELKSDGRFEFDGNRAMYLKGTTEPIPSFLAKKLLAFIDEGIPVDALINFWKHLLLNPDPRVRQQLFGFLEHNGHPITDGGYFLAYKSVEVKRKYDKKTGDVIVNEEYDEDTGELVPEKIDHSLIFKPFHSGKYGMLIKIGEPVSMPREECDNDPNQACSAGLHVGSMAYVGDFGRGDKVVLEVLVSPRNVVSVPKDYNNTKMRVCEYYPIAISNGENDKIYLENDYSTFDQQAMADELTRLEEAKARHIQELETKLEELKKVSGII